MQIYLWASGLEEIDIHFGTFELHAADAVWNPIDHLKIVKDFF